jgi:regulator of sigma E protease
MSVVIFIIILGILIFVHELGHFLIAKKAGIRVDEFAIGFPPRLYSKKSGETTYSLNLIPFGGYVKIHGEDPTEESPAGDEDRNMNTKPAWVRIAVLAGGVAFNIIFAWLLLSVGFMTGLPTSTQGVEQFVDGESALIITGVAANTPASEAGILPGDQLLFLESGALSLQDPQPQEVVDFIDTVGASEVVVLHKRGEEVLTTTLIPNIVDGDPSVGIGLDRVGLVKFPFFEAFVQGAVATFNMVITVAVFLGIFIADIFQGQGDLAQVAGPVGIISFVGDAAHLGFVYLLSFTAFISINLAVLNILPFPALDGGRILFVVIEKIIGRPIKASIAQGLNVLGFVILIVLMVVVTFNDVLRVLG